MLDIDFAGLAKLDPNLRQALANTSVIPPPHGQISNFAHPQLRGQLQALVMGVPFAIATVFFINRIYIKARLMGTWSWDDVTLSIAMVLTIGEFFFKQYGIHIGLMGRHTWDVPLLRLLQPDVSRYYYTAIVTQGWVVLFIRATFFILYLRLFGYIRWARICSWVGLVSVVVAHGAAGIFCFTVANPYEIESWRGYIFNTSIIFGSIGLVSDVAIFVMPYVVIVTLPLTPTQKWGAGTVFLTGLSAIACSTLNLVYRCQLRHSQDYLWDCIPANSVSLTESCIGIICACIPTISFGFRHPGSIYRRVFRLPSEIISRGPTRFTSRPGSRTSKQQQDLALLNSNSQISCHDSWATGKRTDTSLVKSHERSSSSMNKVLNMSMNELKVLEPELAYLPKQIENDDVPQTPATPSSQTTSSSYAISPSQLEQGVKSDLDMNPT